MNEFVQKLKNSGNFVDAYLVAKNLLSKDMGNKELFVQYIDLALEIASYEIVFDERKQYVQDANTALVLFSETTDIDEETLSLIKETKAKISETYHAIETAEQDHNNKIKLQISDENAKILEKLSEIYSQLQSAKTQEEFDKLLKETADTDAKIQKDFLNPNQRYSYEIMTKNFSQAISRKMEELNRDSLMDYNKRAVKCYNDVFTSYKADKSKYKAESNLKALMTSKFFTFDSSRLFNETLVFYNHIYSVIFQEASDDLKFKLTEWALNTVKFDK